MATDNRKTPVFDWQAGEFATDLQGRVRTATGAPAVEQIILKAQQTVRGDFLVYAADPEVPGSRGHTYGSDVDNIRISDLPNSAKLSEMERAVQEALIYDPWIKAVRDVSVQRQGTDEALITATVDHIYGTTTVTFRG
jgi:hypothetical protein